MKFDDIKKLHEKKFREKLKFFVIEGEHTGCYGFSYEALSSSLAGLRCYSRR